MIELLDAPVAEPVLAPQWRNILFATNGQSFVGAYLWPSEEAARKVAEEDIRRLMFTGALYNCARRCLIFREEFSHHMQIPVLTK